MDALDHVIWVMYAYWWNESDSAWHKAWYAWTYECLENNEIWIEPWIERVTIRDMRLMWI